MITVIVLTKNEEKNIVDCLENLKFCDEIIVIDDFSQDRTIEIARKIGAKVFVHSLNNDFSKQRNYGLSKATNEWVLFIDADERVNMQLASEILKSVGMKQIQGFHMRRIDNLWGKKLLHGETGGSKFLRLGQKDAGKWIGKVHERWEVKGELRNLYSPIIHFPHQSVKDFLKEINFYTDLRAAELFTRGTGVKWYSVILYPKGKFIVNYFLKLGFLDGLEGLIFALIMSFHSFLVRGKLWQLNERK